MKLINITGQDTKDATEERLRSILEDRSVPTHQEKSKNKENTRKKASKKQLSESQLKDRELSEISYQNKLKLNEIRTKLKNLNNWKLINGRKIEKKYKIGKFYKAIEFVNKIAKLCKREDHHPDINIIADNANYSVLITYYTHKVNGITMNDIIMAAKTDSIKK